MKRKKRFRNTQKHTGSQSLWTGVLQISPGRLMVRYGGILHHVVRFTGDCVHGDLVECRILRPAECKKMPEVEIVRLVRRSIELLMVRVEKQDEKSLFRLHSLYGSLQKIPLDPSSLLHAESLGWIEEGVYLQMQYSLDTSTFAIIDRVPLADFPLLTEKILAMKAGIHWGWSEKFSDLAFESVSFSSEGEVFDYDQITDETRLGEIGSRLGGDEMRRDYRQWRTMTIDGVDARDLDDALSLGRFVGGDWLVGVHIADVSEYVREDTDLDREARSRGTSTYIPGLVIPMLPEILSNHLCSLTPGVEKLTLSMLMRLSSEGEVLDSFVTPSLIISDHRYTYEEVQQYYDQIYMSTIDTLSTDMIDIRDLYRVYHILSDKRKIQGKILFESTECLYHLGDDRQPLSVERRSRLDAHMLIEEFMVLANEMVARWCSTRHIPFLSRIHEEPTYESQVIIRKLLGLSPQDRVTPATIRSHLDLDTSEISSYTWSRLILPKMTKAYYSESVRGHFGLALDFYTHFTSPIRRYPDLLTHRMIKKFLRKELQKSDKEYYRRQFEKQSKQLTLCEAQSEEYERMISRIMNTRYLSQHLGEIHTGIISGMNDMTLFIELPDGTEGSIWLYERYRYTSTPRLSYDPLYGTLRRSDGGVVYHIGQSIQIQIQKVDMEIYRAYFEIVA